MIPPGLCGAADADVCAGLQTITVILQNITMSWQPFTHKMSSPQFISVDFYASEVISI